MKQKIIAQGAEAKIILLKGLIQKDRIKKSYRIRELDDKIRKLRTRSEIKLLQKASKITNVPLPLTEKTIAYQIKMPYIKGKKLSDNLNKFNLKKQKQICRQIGKDIAKLHDENIIHGDLTTSNMIFVPLGDGEEDRTPIYFIDFGLGYISHKFEDKAVDIHLFKQALEAKHFKNWEILFKEFKKGYENLDNSKIVFERLRAVEKRGRYKH